MALAARGCMIDDGMVIHMLSPRGDRQPVEGALGMFPLEQRADIVPHKRTSEVDGVGCERPLIPERDQGRTHVVGIQVLHLQFVVLHGRTFPHEDLRDRVREVHPRTFAAVRLDNRQPGALPRNDDVPGLDEQRRAPGGGEREYVDRLLQRDAVVHPQERPVEEERRVQCEE